tara:strand:+ start:486 stop:629 length:144 start_codon:yes stop_codon:yes gene_type:complete
MNGETFTTSGFLSQVLGYFISMALIVGQVYQGQEGWRIIDHPIIKEN